MTLQCITTSEAVTGILLAGDALLNLSQQRLNTTAGTPFVVAAQDGLTISDCEGQVHWRCELATTLRRLLSRDITRIVVVSEDNDPLVQEVLAALRGQQIPHCHCVLAADCDADAFMDPEDAEAVAERLRQLGYL